MEENLNSFSSLPDEMLEQVCWKLDAPTLGKFVESNSRAYHICKKVYDQRFKEHREKPRSRLQGVDIAANMPAEAIEGMCRNMDDQTLMNFASQSRRVMNVCRHILTARGLRV